MMDELTTHLRAAGYTLVETHISRVFVGASDVYKLKRPVALGFLDFSTLAMRERACRDELALNRRLAPDVYLGLVGLVRDARGELALRPEDALAGAEVLEWAVHMRRLDESRRADRLLQAGALSPEDVAAIAALLARFHRGVRADEVTAGFGSPERIAQNIEENFAQAAGLMDAYLDEHERDQLARYQRGFLVRERARLEARAAGGFVRDGHGDLRLEHLYRADDGGWVAIDCIEFNERFRYADVCADLAFLAMDLAYHDRTDLAELLIAAYARESADYGLYALLDFYESYRAMVRAKIASMLARDQEVSEQTRARAAREARRYYLLAIAAGARPVAPVRLVVTFGLIASGKSSLAEGLGARLAMPVLSADATRKELLGIAADAKRHDAAFDGAYAPSVTDEVYRTLFARVAEVLRSGRSAVLDATFRSRAHRAAARALAASLSVPVVFLECRCPREVALERLRRRAERPSVSDGRAEIYDEFVASFEPASELPPEEHLVLDTAARREDALARALARVG